MAFNKPQIRVTFHHDVLGTDEVAVTGISLASDANLVPTMPTALQMEDIAQAYTDLLSATTLRRPTYSVFRYAKAAPLDISGHYTAEPVTSTEYNYAGTSGDIPPQNSVVLTLRSGQTLGKGNYGRMYIPHSTMAFVNNRPFSDPSVQEPIADAGAEFVGAINGIFGGFIVPSQVTIMGQGSLGPTSKPVTEVSVGRVVDTQRRRRAQISEEPVFSDVP